MSRSTSRQWGRWERSEASVISVEQINVVGIKIEVEIETGDIPIIGPKVHSQERTRGGGRESGVTEVSQAIRLREGDQGVWSRYSLQRTEALGAERWRVQSSFR